MVGARPNKVLNQRKYLLRAYLQKVIQYWQKIKAAFIAGEAVHILRWCKDGSSEINWYNITEFSDDAPMDDAVTFSITLKGCGEPTFKEDMADPRPAPVQ